jgi:hypothetical protein
MSFISDLSLVLEEEDVSDDVGEFPNLDVAGKESTISMMEKTRRSKPSQEKPYFTASSTAMTYRLRIAYALRVMLRRRLEKLEKQRRAGAKVDRLGLGRRNITRS